MSRASDGATGGWTSEVPVYRLDAVGRTYAGAAPVEALRRCSFVVEPGEYIAVIGPSGSGKSTLLNLLGLIDRPTSGTLAVLGQDTTTLSDRVRTTLRADVIGFVFQSFHLMRARTAMENVGLPLIYQRVPVAERAERVRSALARVGLSERRDARCSTLSGGEAQRVAIARAVAGNPRVLLCDEPTGNLDSRTSDQIIDLLEGLHHDGLTIMLVTHDERLAARAHRTIGVRDGIVREVAAR
jgi:putative ABC transport system ATP-binding protein